MESESEEKTNKPEKVCKSNIEFKILNSINNVLFLSSLQILLSFTALALIYDQLVYF